MAKNTNTPAPTNGTTNKADAVRAYAKANPAAKPSEISKALVAQGIDVAPGRVSGVLNTGKRRGGLSVDSIKLAAQFVKSNGGKIDAAEQAIQKVGGFVESCGSAQAALEALQSYKAVAEAVA